MILKTRRVAVALMVFMAASVAAAIEPEGWPRVMETPNYAITMYEPQIDSWKDDRCEARASAATPEPSNIEVAGPGPRGARPAAAGDRSRYSPIRKGPSPLWRGASVFHHMIQLRSSSVGSPSRTRTCPCRGPLSVPTEMM